MFNILTFLHVQEICIICVTYMVQIMDLHAFCMCIQQ